SPYCNRCTQDAHQDLGGIEHSRVLVQENDGRECAFSSGRWLHDGSVLHRRCNCWRLVKQMETVVSAIPLPPPPLPCASSLPAMGSPRVEEKENIPPADRRRPVISIDQLPPL